MAEDVFASYGLQDRQGMFRVADALHQKNDQKRLCGDFSPPTRFLTIEICRNLSDITNVITRRLVESWELFQDKQQGDEFRRQLSEFVL